MEKAEKSERRNMVPSLPISVYGSFDAVNEAVTRALKEIRNERRPIVNRVRLNFGPHPAFWSGVQARREVAAGEA